MAYHVLVDGEQRGPFETATVAEMIDRGEVTADTLVWTTDMSDWAAAGTVDGLSQLFGGRGTAAATEAQPTPRPGGSPRLAMGRALGDGLRVIAQQPPRLIGVIVLYAILGLVAVAPVFALFLFGVVSVGDGEGVVAAVGVSGLLLVGYLMMLAITAALYGGLCAVMLDAVRGTQIQFSLLFAGFKRIIPLVLFMLIVGLVGVAPFGLIIAIFGDSIGAWILLVFLPLIFLLIALILGPFYIMDAGAGPVQAVAGSFRTVMRLGWFRVFGTLLVLVILAFVLLFTVAIVTGLATAATVGSWAGVNNDIFVIAEAIISGLPHLLINFGVGVVFVGVIAAIYEQARAG